MQVIRKDPGKPPRLVEIPNTLKALQQAVGGYIETVSFCEDALVICNEEGLLMGLAPNCSFLGIPFVGTILMHPLRGNHPDRRPVRGGVLQPEPYGPAAAPLSAGNRRTTGRNTR